MMATDTTGASISMRILLVAITLAILASVADGWLKALLVGMAICGVVVVLVGITIEHCAEDYPYDDDNM